MPPGIYSSKYFQGTLMASNATGRWKEWLSPDGVPHREWPSIKNKTQIIDIILLFLKSLRWEKQKHVGKEIWEKMGAAGMLGINIPAEHGGIGGEFKDSVIVIEEQ